MKFQYDGKYWLLFADGMSFSIEREVWERIKKLKESENDNATAKVPQMEIRETLYRL